jgi:hypothetical protein
MYLHTVESRTPQQIFDRMTEMEKMGMRMATPGRLEYLSQTVYLRESGNSVECMKKVQALCIKELESFTTMKSWWQTQTWKF